MGFDLKRSEYVSKFDSWDIKWIPTIYQTDSKMIHVTCTAVCDDLIEIKYSFIIAPVIRERDLPTCEDGTAKLTQ